MEANQDYVPGSDTKFLNLLASSRKTRVTVVVLVVEFFLNILVATLKLIVGFGLGSLSMIADGYHSLLDGASNVIGFVGVVAASRPPDSNHPYGHGKLETLASMAIGITLFFAAYEVISTTINTTMQINSVYTRSGHTSTFSSSSFSSGSNPCFARSSF